MIFLYIDPGTTSVVVSIISSLLLMLWVNIKSIFYKLPFLIKNKNFVGNLDFSNDLVFFNEGSKYWLVFKPVLDELIKKKCSFIYLTSDKDDPGLNYNSQLSKSYYLGPLNTSIFLLNKLKCKMCVTTTPQLNILEWKRSKDVKHYCYIFHSPIDIHAYKLFSFDYYDSILCTSHFQIKNLKLLEYKRKSKKKIFFETGCTYYDMIDESSNFKRDYILIAPSWDRSFFLEMES